MRRPLFKKFFSKIVQLVRDVRPREQLDYLFEIANPAAPLAERIQWLEQLMHWIRTASLHEHSFDQTTGQLHNVRIRFLLHLLERRESWKKNVAAILRSFIQETSARTLFSEIGLGQQKGFLAEASDRVIGRLLPRPQQQTELSELFVRIFADENDAKWVANIPPSLVAQILELIRFEAKGDEERIFSNWKKDIQDAMVILGARISSLSTSAEILSRVQEANLESYPFLKLNHEILAFVESIRLESSGNLTNENICEQTAKSRKYIQKIYRDLEMKGVSVALVYSLENISDAMSRVEQLSNLRMADASTSTQTVPKFLASLVQERLAQTTLRNLISTNLHLLSSKIVERAGAYGEHYIARTRKEYFQMIRAGLGGGGVMVLTTLVKFWITSLNLPLFFEGLSYSLNYSFGFILIQFLGFTLATKQPSATASALAGKLKNSEEDGEVREFVNEVCLMTRTQFAALVGNLVFLIPFALALDFALSHFAGKHFFTPETSLHVLDSLHPLKSFSIPMAFLTGVYLWMSSIVAGWSENWVVFHRLPEAIASQRKLIAVLGAEKAKRLGEWTLEKATLFGGNISLGFLMGFTSVFGHFVGLPFDVRHVTLSAASLSFALNATAPQGLVWQQWLPAVLGVFLIGALNFAVGYFLAFTVAVRAREVPINVLKNLRRALRVRLRRRPLELFIPPKSRS